MKDLKLLQLQIGMHKFIEKMGQLILRQFISHHKSSGTCCKTQWQYLDINMLRVFKQ